MNVFQKAMSWLGDKFEAWLDKVGKENRPEDHDYNAFPEDDPLIGRSDLVGDERSDWDDRHL